MATTDLSEVFISSHDGAIAVMDALFELLECYNQVTVSDFYDLVDLPSKFTDTKIGWTDLNGKIEVLKTDTGYFLKMPEPKPL